MKETTRKHLHQIADYMTTSKSIQELERKNMFISGYLRAIIEEKIITDKEYKDFKNLQEEIFWKQYEVINKVNALINKGE